ncbi:DsbA family protein [Desulfosarcina sp.]|uniref:DsbA family protein n=1 Tax=Desulfosarcina sp. TaxID=2027861 RepID=UPI003970694D
MRKTVLILGIICLGMFPRFAFPAEAPANIFSDGYGPIEIIIFSDYFCPPCQKIEPYLEEALTKLHQSGAKITLVDMPIHEMTPLFSRYFLYAANAADSFTQKLTVRRKLFDIAQSKAVDSEWALIQKLKENQITLARLDVKPIFNEWLALIKRFAVTSTPTCAVKQPGREMITYSGGRDISTGIDQLLAGLSLNSSND